MARALCRRLLFSFVRRNEIVVDFSLYPSSSAKPEIDILPPEGEKEEVEK